jgi:hypothetical protein
VAVLVITPSQEEREEKSDSAEPPGSMMETKSVAAKTGRAKKNPTAKSVVLKIFLFITRLLYHKKNSVETDVFVFQKIFLIIFLFPSPHPI